MKPEYTFSRLVLKPCLALLIGFAALVGLVHLQPQDLNPLFALVQPPENCATPCWQGIRPGVTTADEAIAVLEAHPWIADMTSVANAVTWRWNGAQPFPANRDDGGSLGISGEVVSTITLETAARLGDLWLLLDQPEEGAFAFVGLVLTMPEYLVEYQGSDLTVTTRVTCGDFWTGNTTVTLYPAGSARQEAFDLSHAREASCKPSRIFFSS